MRKLITALVATAFVGALAVLGPSPALAVSVCVGTGEATTTPLSYLDAITGAPGAFHLTIGGGSSVGGCVHSNLTTAMLTASGSLTGGCGKSTGNGALTDGGGSHPFSYQSAGSLLVITAHPAITVTIPTITPTVTVSTGVPVGVASAVPLPGRSNSCLDDTATKFQVTGAIVNL